MGKMSQSGCNMYVCQNVIVIVSIHLIPLFLDPRRSFLFIYTLKSLSFLSLKYDCKKHVIFKNNDFFFK